MNCGQCLQHVASVDQLFFFVKSDTEVHLALKPEHRLSVEHSNLVPFQDGKKERLQCRKGHAVGVLLPYGPDGTVFIGFGKEKVQVLGQKPFKKGGWKQFLSTSPYSRIEKRGMDSFFGPGHSPPKKLKQAEPITAPKPDVETIKFADDSNLDHFRWDNLLRSMKPRDYQILAFLEALRQNLIVALRTGAGKTLIAAMLLKRMREINPGYLGLMIVDRVPLVFQQSNAIREQTGLITCGMCGETRTQCMIDKIKDGTYDCVIATAGLIVELLRYNLLSLDMFSCIVIDECHHTRKNHDYNKVLDYWRQLGVKPRVLALSASPFPCESIEKGLASMQEFRKLYNNAGIYHPDVTINQQNIDWIVVPDDESLSSLVKYLDGEINSAFRLFKHQSGDTTFELQPDWYEKKHLSTIRGEIGALQVQYLSSSGKKYLDRMYSIFETVELARSMGVNIAVGNLATDLPDLLPRLEMFKTTRESPRLRALKNEIENASSTSKILVFVDTRSVARLMKRYMCARFASLNPSLLVGHGGFDGMGWEDEQEEVLRQFREGKSRLIVCTSVLEEGLDVSECDLVIRFNGVATLIKFIQSKGRARKQNSRFVVFLSEHERDNIGKIENQERFMVSLLERYGDQQFPTPFCQRIRTMIDGSQLNTTINRVSVDDSDPHNLSTAAGGNIELFFEGKDNVDEVKLKNEIWERISRDKILKPKRIVLAKCWENNNSAGGGVVCMFQRNQVVAYVYLIKEQRLSRIYDSYRDHCAAWDFDISVEGRRTRTFARYLPQHLSEATESNSMEFNCEGISFGKLANFRFTKIRVDDSEFVNVKLTITENKELKCSFVLRQETDYDMFVTPYCIHVDREILGRNVIRCVDRYSTYIYFLLTSTPILTQQIDHEHSPYLMQIDDDEPKIERVCGFDNLVLKLLAANPVLCLQMKKCVANAFDKFTLTSTRLPVPIFDSRIDVETCIEYWSCPQLSYYNDFECSAGALDKVWKPPELIGFNEEQYNCMWNICVLASLRNVWLCDQVLIQLQNECNSTLNNLKKSSMILSHICSRVENQFEPLDILQEWKFFQSLSTTKIEQLLSLGAVKNCYRVKRVLITPSRIIYKLPVAIASNRLLRKQQSESSSWDLLVVSFTDERSQRLSDPATFHHVESVMANGVNLMGRKYVYLCASASQLRDHKAYFIYPEKVLKKVRSEIISNGDTFDSVAKYTTRLGLFCTADTPICNVPNDQVKETEDIKTCSKEIVTDGAGQISLDFAREVSKCFNLQSTPAAFQIRYAGKKGIVVTDFQNLAFSATKDKLMFRPSMGKFETNHENFGVNNYSKLAPLRLNRDVITLFDALKVNGNSLSECLHTLQEKALESYLTRFTEKESAFEILAEYLPQLTISHMASSSFNILKEPFWSKLIQLSYHLDIWSLRSKTQIPLKDGALLMGIPDPLGVLNDNEVFVLISPEKGTDRVLDTHVLIYRNPCLHPGDVRKVRAVNIPALCPWKNVLILPAQLATFSLSTQCSGGDLDGDKFAVIWDQNLLNAIPEVVAALDYTNLVSQNPAIGVKQSEDLIDHNTSNNQISQEKMAKFFRDVISNDALGRVAHMHLAICDSLPKGALDELAIELAKSQSVAVDFPKTGIRPTVPKEAKEVFKDNQYPDFMEKPQLVSYESQKVLGRLYRRCCSIIYAKELQAGGSVEPDKSFQVPGFENFINDGRFVYERFKRDISQILFAYGLRREHEIFLGQPLVWTAALDSDRDHAKKALRAERENLRDKYRELFYRGITNIDVQQKAAAWYFIAYTDKTRKRCLSFPWLILDDVLCTIKKQSIQSQQLDTPEIKAFGVSARQVFLDKASEFVESVNDKLSHLPNIKVAVDNFTQEELFSTVVYGSVSHMLCSSWSDLDVCVIALPKFYQSSWISDECSFRKVPQKDQENDILSRVVFPAVDTIALSKRHAKSAHVPVIKLTLGSEHNPIDVDICANSLGFKKTQYIHALYMHNKGLFNALWVIMRWSRYVGITKLNPESECILPSAEVYLLAIFLLFGKLPRVPERNYKENWTPEQVVKSINEADSLVLCATHHYIERFFTEASKLCQQFTLTWPVEGGNEVKFESNLDAISNKSLAALHCLRVTSDIGIVLDLALNATTASNEIVKRVPRSLAIRISEVTEFHAMLLSSQTGAVVTFEKEPVLVMRAKGSASALEKLKHDFTKLSRAHNSLMLGHIPYKTSRYFIEGSTLLFVQQASQNAARLSFKPSSGPHQKYHTDYERTIPVLSSNRMLLDAWKKEASYVLANHFKQQLQQFPMNDQSAIDSLHLAAGFGSFYAINTTTTLPATNQTLALDEMKALIEKARRSRRKYERKDFEFSPGMAINRNKSNMEEAKKKEYTQVPLSVMRPSYISPKLSDKYPKKMNKASKKGLASSFCPGMFVNNVVESDNVVNLCWQSYFNVLSKCGYTVAEPANKPHFAKITLVPSSSYVAVVRVDEKLDVLDSHERRFNWAHVTILNGNNEVPRKGQRFIQNHDIRLTIQNSRPITQDMHLYKFIYPTGNELSPIEVSRQNYCPKIAEHFKQSGNEKRVIHARIVLRSEYFRKLTHDSSIFKFVAAHVGSGIEYSGENLSVSRKFCEMSVSFDVEKLGEILKNRSLTNQEVEHISHFVLNESLLVSQTLRHHNL